jgi:hypothetical protein
MLDGDPSTYRDWAQDYYDLAVPEGWDLPLEGVERIYRHEPLSAELVSMLHPGTHLIALAADVQEIAYPQSQQY